MAYLLDANVFMQAKNLHYGFDFCPAFWDWLSINNSKGIVFSIEKVADEIQAGNDDLAAWAVQRGDAFFLRPDERLIPALSRTSAWATSQSYDPAAVNTFFQVADFYLVAQALAHKHVIVTHEVWKDTVKKVKIPNACLGLGIKNISPFDMLRIERAKFVLQAPSA
jgi:hypothetical protein